MANPWYYKLFGRVAPSDSKSTHAKADQGDAEAQFGLGLKYGNGSNEGDDFAEAIHWYRKAANQNHSLAQFNLGMMYARGQGMPPDEAEAVVWIRRAAEAGDAGAQFDLGTRYHRASVGGLQIDALESRIEAYKWFHLAAVQGYKGSDAACERVTLGMSREEVTEANQRASTFAAKQG